ncbi:hypothetical protein OS493_018766 [Desmophyllum pertusum]|uniref:Uncharacterized protein n=1 Tax=Desmophyllum pertusum TaxID=174260 RepID=A0A9X0CWW5_9CNID|nr:hypothetical protein OS493_018766 [Desmophyllum pertusum]
MWKLITYQRKNVLGLFRASLPEKVPSIPCTAQNVKDCRRHMSDDPASQDVHAATDVSAEHKIKFPKRGNFFIWNLTSNAGGSLMTLKPGSRTPEIECSGSYAEDNNNNNPSLTVIHDTTVFPIATWSIALTLNGTDQYHVSVDDNRRIVAKVSD